MQTALSPRWLKQGGRLSDLHLFGSPNDPRSALDRFSINVRGDAA
jgi:hypothetical protein